MDGKSDFECDEWLASSGAMIVIEDAVRQGNVYDLYETFAVIACLLLWTTLFSHSITKFCRTLLEPLRALVDDMKAMHQELRCDIAVQMSQLVVMRCSSAVIIISCICLSLFPPSFCCRSREAVKHITWSMCQTFNRKKQASNGP